MPKTKISTETAAADSAVDEDEDEMTEEERFKAVDRDHMKKLHAGIFAYREKYGSYPEYLSQLVPEFRRG